MSSSIVPASDRPREEITRYLLSQGYVPEIAAWKYFDDAFNRGRNRGWAWVKDGRVAGFIGQLPFQLARGDERAEARWLCDWSIEDFEKHRGAGVRLFKRALQDGLHFVLGGNANSLGPMEKMASRTRHAADVEMRLFLRAGAVLERLGSRVPIVRALKRTPLSQIPLPRKSSGASSRSVSVEEGVSPELAPLLESGGLTSATWSTLYDHAYVSWQIGRCPTLRSWTIATRDYESALVLWHPRLEARSWRGALWTRGGEAAAVAEAAVKLALSHGGSEISIVASRSDTAQQEILRSLGFSPTKTARPLFVYDAPDAEVQIDDLSGLSFLAADLSYRF